MLQSSEPRNTSTTSSSHITTNRKAFVLLSGGLDSTTCLHKAIFDYAPTGMDVLDRIMVNRQWANRDGGPFIPINWVEATSIDYGQRHLKEAEFAAETCNTLGIKHTVLNIGGLLGASALTDPSREIPNVSYADIKGVSPSYVPFRNGTMLSILTAHAVNWVNQHYPSMGSSIPRNVAGVYHGAHADDAAGDAYPDCTVEFMGAMANAIHVGTYYAVRLHTPLLTLSKAEIVTLGSSLGVDFANTWSCYKGETLHCGVCPTCRARKEAFQKADIKDPTEYAA